MFTQLLQNAARALSAAKLPYAVLGGQAVLLYGEPRLTKDVDITLGVGPEALDAVLAAAREAGWEALVEDAAGFVRDTFVLPMRDKASDVRVDLIFSYTPFERESIANARMRDIGGTPVAFVSPEALVVHKIFAGRPRDLEDARTILRRQPALDLDYARRWLRTFGEGADQDYVARLDALMRNE